MEGCIFPDPAPFSPGDGPDRFFLVTCEHGGNRVPAPYGPFFAGREELLASHRGYDAGALALARDLAQALAAPLVAATTTRLLVDLNRSPGHRALYSEVLGAAPRALKEEIAARHYWPHRQRVEKLVGEAVAGGKRVVQIASHSFTPVLGEEVRKADIGILYDPGRPGEAALCAAWQRALAELAPQWRVRRNYPYTGKSDGLCTYLRRRFPPESYVGIELEINQKHVKAGGAPWHRLREAVTASLLQALGRGG